MYCPIADKSFSMYDGDTDDYTTCTANCDYCLIYYNAVNKEDAEESYNNCNN